MTFNPSDAAGEDAGIFGLPPQAPFTPETAKLVFLPVPWDVTTSYGKGTSKGPAAILRASHQLDLFDGRLGEVFRPGLTLLPESPEIQACNREGYALLDSEIPDAERVRKINALSDRVNRVVYDETKSRIAKGQIVGVVGGDHSSPYGAIKAVAEREGAIGILHFDAHFDLREAYQGHTHSHASIFFNVLKDIPQVQKFHQVGLRDFCQEEIQLAKSNPARHRYFLDQDLADLKLKGRPWTEVTEDILFGLPEKIWISFDIDALDPRYCPHTGTPVPGGLEFSEAVHVIRMVQESGRKIVGFDLCEVAPPPEFPEGDEWDANVGMRLLYKLAGHTLKSQGLLS